MIVIYRACKDLARLEDRYPYLCASLPKIRTSELGSTY